MVTLTEQSLPSSDQRVPALLVEWESVAQVMEEALYLAEFL
jgi:hypothetical protein